MPIDRGPGWEQDASGQWIFNPETAGLDTGAASPGDFKGTVQSLDFGQELAGSTLASDWSKYFDPYDTSKEERLGRAAATDIGQLEDAWSLQSQQLGSAWGQKRDQLGAQFGTAFRQGKQASASASGKSGLAFSGTTYGMQKGTERDAFRQYGLGVQAGQSAYEQAMATGQLGLRQATTDVYQGLESDIYGERDRWQRDQRANLNTLLGMDIWGEDIEGGGVRPNMIDSFPPPGSVFDRSQFDGIPTNPGIDIDPSTLSDSFQSSCISGGGTWDPDAGTYGQCSTWG